MAARKDDSIKKLKSSLLRGTCRAAEYWLEILDDERVKPELRMKAAEQLMSYGVGKGALPAERGASPLRGLSLSERLAAAEEDEP